MLTDARVNWMVPESWWTAYAEQAAKLGREAESLLIDAMQIVQRHEIVLFPEGDERLFVPAGGRHDASHSAMQQYGELLDKANEWNCYPWAVLCSTLVGLTVGMIANEKVSFAHSTSEEMRPYLAEIYREPRAKRAKQ